MIYEFKFIADVEFEGREKIGTASWREFGQLEDAPRILRNFPGCYKMQSVEIRKIEQ